jgi:hypothetical protein
MLANTRRQDAYENKGRMDMCFSIKFKTSFSSSSINQACVHTKKEGVGEKHFGGTHPVPSSQHHAELILSLSHYHLPAILLLLMTPAGMHTAQSGTQEQLSLPGAHCSEIES